jgi:adenylate cyclase
MKKWLNDHNLAVSCIGVSVLVALLYLASPVLHRVIKFPYLVFEYKFQDWVAVFGKTAPQDRTVYFLADDAPSHTLDQLWDEDFEASPILRKMQQPFWPRDVYAAILDRLVTAGARVVAFDYMFKGKYEGDDEFRAALEKHRDRVVVGSQIDPVKRGLSLRPQISPPPKSLGVDDLSDPRVGFINIYPDEDGITRRFRFGVRLMELAERRPAEDDPIFESLPVRTIRQAGLGLLVPNKTDARLIRFAWKGETLRATRGTAQSVAEIFVPSIWEANYQSGDFFRDKIVIVGPEGNYTKDVAQSPFGIIAGPEFHLNIINAMLTGAFLRETPLWGDLLLLLGAAVFAAMAGKIFSHPILRMALVLLIGAGFFRAALWVFDHHDTVIPVFTPLLALVGSTFTAIVWQQIIERLERARTRRMFERYVSRDAVKELLDNPESVLNALGGTRKKVTVLFSDLRGFTTFTETGNAQALVAQLNEYFGHMVNIVFDNRGTLDKFMGDAVMAQWGGITTAGEQEDAVRAVRSAIQMRERLIELNANWRTRGIKELQFGIGLNHGESITGNIGCEAKMEITLIGDAVNTASRLEGMTKQFHVDLLIGESVADLVRDRFILRTVALSQPKGKTKPLEIFTVLDEQTGDVKEPKWLAEYERGVKFYRVRQFAEAAACFEEAQKEIPDDWLCSDYLRECQAFLANPPPDNWTPVDVMTSK